MDGQSERLGETVFLFAPALVRIHRDPGEDELQPGEDGG
jgi:FtsZ-interacting cell division protein YlmF